MVLNTEAGCFHALNGVGTVVWEQLAQPSTLEELTRRLCARFAVASHECQRDVAVFVEALQARGLVTHADHPAAASPEHPVA